MLSGLEFVDWVALLIALVLLAVTGLATYLSHTLAPELLPQETGSAGGGERQSPQHAATDPASAAEMYSMQSEYEPAHQAGVPGSPQASQPAHAEGHDEPESPAEHIDLVGIEARAKRLRSRRESSARPVAEPVVAAVQSAGTEPAARGFELRGPGFFEDPIGRYDKRYWNGQKWTEYVKDGDVRYIDHL